MKKHVTLTIYLGLLLLSSCCYHQKSETEPFVERVSLLLADLKSNPVQFDWIDISGPPSALKLLKMGDKVIKPIVTELQTVSNDQQAISLCALLYEVGGFEKAPVRYRVMYLVRMMKNVCKTDAFGTDAFPNILPFDEYIEAFKKIGKETVPYLTPIVMSHKSTVFTYPKEPDKVSSWEEDFLQQVIHIIIVLGAEDTVPARLRARYYLWDNWGAGNDGVDIAPLIEIGKIAVPEILEMLSAKIIPDDWATAALASITFQHFPQTEQEWISDDLRRIVTEFSKWWELNKSKTRIQWAIEGLKSQSDDTRYDSYEYLQNLTKKDFGYDPLKSVRENEESVRKWNEWFKKNKK